MINIVIPEPITSLNKGEVAILEGIDEALKLLGDCEITVYSPLSWIEDDKRNYDGKYNVVGGINLFTVGYSYMKDRPPLGSIYSIKNWCKVLLYSLLTRVNRRLANMLIKDELLQAMSNADLLIAGHDGMLAYDDFWLVLAARIMNKPIALFGGGNDGKGRCKRRIRKFYQYAIHNSILCTVRDEGTRNFLIDNGVSPEKVHLFPDPAFMMKPCNSERVEEILTKENISLSDDKPLYGLIPVRGGIVFNKSYSMEKDKKRKHQLRVKLWVLILEHLVEKTNAHFVFLPHCIGPTINNDDRQMSRDIFNELSNCHKRFTLIENEYMANDLKGLMKHFDFVLGERTHALIGSLSVATPCFALTVEEDLRMHNIVNKMFNRPTFNLNNPDVNELKEILCAEWNRRKEISLELEKRAEVIHEEAYKAAILLRDRVKNVLRMH